jgi:hypothetical protein
MTSTSRQNWPQILLEGCGAGILLMFRYTWLHLAPLHIDLYHRLLPMNSVYGGVAIDLLVACLFCTGVLWLLERFDAGGRTLLWTVAATIFVTQLWAFVAWLGYLDVHLIKPTLLTLVCLAVGVVLWFWKRSFYRQAVQGFRLVLALLGLCIVWMLPQLVYMAIRPEPHDSQRFMRSVSPAEVPSRRIVWVVFDELSQDQMLDHRQPGISLPALDQFRSDSVMFSNVDPAGYYTELVLPSLIWGKSITDERSDLAGNLFVKSSTRRWEGFAAGESIFAQAQQAGWSTGVAGWYNPYCRTYAPWLDWCAWTLRSAMPGNYQQGKSLWWNANAPLVRLEAKLAHRKYQIPTSPETHADDYDDLMEWSHELIANENIGFVFLHLPLPHPGGFYDRKTGRLGVNGSYLDNLVLTDRSLSQLMKWIGETTLASKTTVIVCSDHSWRVPLWRISPMWTKEDATVSGGRFDPRPVLMVHFPGQTVPEVIEQPFPALREHDLVDSLLHYPMNATGLEDWVHRQ